MSRTGISNLGRDSHPAYHVKKIRSARSRLFHSGVSRSRSSDVLRKTKEVAGYSLGFDQGKVLHPQRTPPGPSSLSQGENTHSGEGSGAYRAGNIISSGRMGFALRGVVTLLPDIRLVTGMIGSGGRQIWSQMPKTRPTSSRRA